INQHDDFFLQPTNQGEMWQHHFQVRSDTAIQVYLSNNDLPDFDSLHITVKAIPDNAPQIVAQQTKDSISGRQVLLMGNAADDYGLSQLLFHYIITNEQKQIIREKSIAILQPNNAKTLNYHYYFD